jgi:hypothetical protein
MFASQETFGGLRSPCLDREEFAAEEPLFKGRIPASRGNLGKELEVYIAATGSQRALARNLVNRMYAWRGYGANHTLDPTNNSTTFVALLEGEVVGTLTLTVDSCVGLAADKTFEDVLGARRRVPGTNLCELAKFACNPSEDARFLLAPLFHAMFVYGTENFDCTDLFIEVNPRHIRFYEAMLGFRKVGELRTNRAVDAPSQLMCLKVAEISGNIGRHAGRTDRDASRSLYPFFLSHEEEMCLRTRLRKRFEGSAAGGGQSCKLEASSVPPTAIPERMAACLPEEKRRNSAPFFSMPFNVLGRFEKRGQSVGA